VALTQDDDLRPGALVFVTAVAAPAGSP